MNEKLKKTENILICSILEKDLKGVTQACNLVRPTSDKKEKVSSKSVSPVKLDKQNDNSLNLNNTLFVSKNNMSICIDLNRKHFNNNIQHNILGINNGLKSKELTNNNAVKLQNLSSIKSQSQEKRTNKKTRNKSYNQYSFKSYSKKNLSNMKDSENCYITSQITNIMKKLTNLSNNNQVSRENIISSKNLKKTKSLSSNTPASTNYISTAELNIKGSIDKIKKENILNTHSKTSLKINKINKGLNKKTIEEGDIIYHTFRSSLNKFQKLLNDVVNKNKNNISFLKEIDYSYREIMSKALCGNFIDENDKDAYFHKEIKRLQRKNDNLEKKFYDLTQIKDENEQFKQIKTFLCNFQTQVAEINLIDEINNNKNSNVKSRSLIRKDKKKPQSNKLVHKFEDGKNQIADFKSSLNKREANKNTTPRNPTKLEINIKKLESETKSEKQKKYKKIYRARINANDINTNLETSLNSNSSEISIENTQEMIKNKFPFIPKLDLIKNQNEIINLEKECQIDNISILSILNNNLSPNKDHDIKSTGFLLNFQNLPKTDYNQEFMSKFEEFSPSWRKECKKLKGLDQPDINNDILNVQKCDE